MGSDPRWTHHNSDDHWPVQRVLACLARPDFGPSDLPLTVWLGVCGVVITCIIALIGIVVWWQGNWGV